MSHQIDPLSIDFRAFQVLICVHRHGSFTRAAEELGVNQSAISYTIDKLRQVFDDPLFVREGRALITTARCQEVLQMADRMSNEFLALAVPQVFDPALSTERLVIACNYYEQVLFLPSIVRALKNSAPNIALEVIEASDSGHERLMQGDADILIGPFERKGASFFTRALYEEKYSCLLDKSHPMAGQSFGLEDYLSFDHVQVTYGGKWKSRYILELEAMNHRLNVALKVPSPVELVNLIKGTHLVATVPERLSRQAGRGLIIKPSPIVAPFIIRLVWTSRTHRSKMHIWARDLINKTMRAQLDTVP